MYYINIKSKYEMTPNAGRGAIPVIGVLGGIGPDASNEFDAKITSEMRNRGLIKSNSDFPLMITYRINPNEPSGDELTREEIFPYEQGIKLLERNNVDLIAMVCNTIHLYRKEFQRYDTKAPILDLPKEVENRLKQDNVNKIGVLGSGPTIRQGLYQFDDFENVETSDDDIETLNDTIQKFNRGYDRPGQADRVMEIAQRYLDEGAESIILGCTEFAVMLGDGDLPTINTIDVLVDATIREHQKMLERVHPRYREKVVDPDDPFIDGFLVEM